MGTTIYSRLVRYFIGLMIITCLSTCLLFFFTAGRSMIKGLHQVVRKQAVFLADRTQDVITRSTEWKQVDEFLSGTADIYDKTSLYLFDYEGNLLSSSGASGSPAVLTREMRDAADRKGVFVDPGHLSGRTVYVLNLLANGSVYYLYYEKYSSVRSGFLPLFTGLGIMVVLLILAIYPLARSFTRPIEQLTAGLNRIASGRFESAGVMDGGNDEFGKLIQVFRQMGDSVHEMVASKKKFLMDISHELRSPLGRMEVSLELLREACPDQSARQYISTMASEISFMAEMSRSLSSYARINLPDYALKKEMVPPHEIIGSAFDRYRETAARQGVEFYRKCDPGLPVVAADPSQMTRVMNNLLDNAFRYCPRGGTVRLGGDETDGWIRLYVSDTGPGVPRELEKRIFEPLFRADGARSRDTGGLGLGLAICEKIMARHGGRIRYTRGGGETVFRVYLPFNRG